MTANPWLVRYLAQAPMAHRPLLSVVFGESDLIARHAPIHLVPEAFQALWLMHRVLTTPVEDPTYSALAPCAQTLLESIGQQLEPLVSFAPNDARELGDGGSEWR